MRKASYKFHFEWLLFQKAVHATFLIPHSVGSSEPVLVPVGSSPFFVEIYGWQQNKKEKMDKKGRIKIIAHLLSYGRAGRGKKCLPHHRSRGLGISWRGRGAREGGGINQLHSHLSRVNNGFRLFAHIFETRRWFRMLSIPLFVTAGIWFLCAASSPASPYHSGKKKSGVRYGLMCFLS